MHSVTQDRKTIPSSNTTAGLSRFNADFEKIMSDIYFGPDAKYEIKKMILDDLSDKLDSFFDEWKSET